MPERNPQRRNVIRSFRGRSLILLGCVWLTLGVGVIFERDPHGESYWHLLIPADVRAGLWIASAAVAFVGAFFVRDRWVFAILTIMPMIRLTSSLWSWAMAIIPSAPGGGDLAWYRAIWYLLMLGAVWLLTSVQERALISDSSGGKSAGDDP